MNSPGDEMPANAAHHWDCPSCGSTETFSKRKLAWPVMSGWFEIGGFLLFSLLGSAVIIFSLVFSNWWLLIFCLPLFVAGIWFLLAGSTKGFEVYCKNCGKLIQLLLKK